MIISSFCLIFQTLSSLFSARLDWGNGVRGSYISSNFATFCTKKFPISPKSFPKQKHKQLIISHLQNLSTTKSFPSLIICQLHLIIYKVQQTHRSNKTVGFVFFVSQVPSFRWRTALTWQFERKEQRGASL